MGLCPCFSLQFKVKLDNFEVTDKPVARSSKTKSVKITLEDDAYKIIDNYTGGMNTESIVDYKDGKLSLLKSECGIMTGQYKIEESIMNIIDQFSRERFNVLIIEEPWASQQNLELLFGIIIKSILRCDATLDQSSSKVKKIAIPWKYLQSEHKKQIYN